MSIARKIQDPLVEYTQVCSSDDDILCLKLHPLQVNRHFGDHIIFVLGHAVLMMNLGC